MRRVLVFCGSSPGRLPAYVEAAAALGDELAAQGLGLVYGGAQVGVMGAVADAVLAAGGEVIGVIPRMLVEKEVAHTGLTDLRVVETMHQRKALMESLADGVIALPGGFGTLEELFEIVTWAQLGIHTKPVGAARTSPATGISCWPSSTTWSPSVSCVRSSVTRCWSATHPPSCSRGCGSTSRQSLDKWLDRSQT